MITLLLAGVEVHAETAFETAQRYNQQGELAAAAAELKRLLSREPAHAAGRQLLGEIHLAQGDYPAAEKELSRAQSLGLNGPRLTLALAKSQVGLGHAEAARQILGRTPPPDPELASQHWLILADIHYAADELKQSEQAYQQAWTLTQEPQALAGLATVAIRQHQGAKALGIVKAMPADQHSYRLKYLSGEAYLLKRQPEKALEAFSAALEMQPEAPLALLGNVRAHLLQGQQAQAREAVDHLLRVVPNWPRALALSSLLHLQEGNPQEAKTILDPLLAQLRSPEELLLLSALANLALDNTALAEQQLTRHLATAAEDRRARLILAELHRQQGRLEIAEQTLAPLLTEEAADADARALLGAIRLKQGTPSAAVDAFRQSLALDAKPAVARPLALAEYLSGEHQAAIQRLEALAEAGADPSTDMLLVRAYLVGGDAEKARQLLAKRLNAEAAPLLYHLLAGSLETRLENGERAIHHFDQALVLEPHSVPALLGKAQLALGENDLVAAEDFYQAAIQAAPDDIHPLSGYTNLLFQQNKSEQALSIAKSFQQQRVNDLAATRFYLSVLERAHQWVALSEALEQAAARFPDRAEFQLAAAKLALSQQDQRAADRYVNALLLQHPDFVPGHLTKATIFLSEGSPQQALSVLDTLPAKAQSQPEVTLIRGDALAASGQFNSAEQAYLDSYAAKPNARVLGKITRLWLSRGQPQEALELLEQHTQQFPQDAAALIAKAHLHHQTGQLSAAVTAYEQATEKQPTNPIAWNNLAWLYLQQSDPRATTAAERAIALGPDTPSIQDTAGWIFLHAERHHEALELLNQAAERLPSDPSVQFHYAVALARNGQEKAAHAILSPWLASNFPEKEAAASLFQELTLKQ
ncbi:tetratricopeptide repeat protein [Motiliproteus sp. SC1-56]|uniref:tetratricopeptide repeat protein n=1 Tax=Motiliproteus sp. SC1-56 TaxID=2799565 RepID=UPI001A908C9A|nr:tetratricopeptide repeat protein [Motiliproteus sp. SC1-56]